MFVMGVNEDKYNPAKDHIIRFYRTIPQKP